MTVVDLQPEDAVEAPRDQICWCAVARPDPRPGIRTVFAHGSGSGRLSPLDQVVKYTVGWFLVHLNPGEN